MNTDVLYSKTVWQTESSDALVHSVLSHGVHHLQSFCYLHGVLQVLRHRYRVLHKCDLSLNKNVCSNHHYSRVKRLQWRESFKVRAACSKYPSLNCVHADTCCVMICCHHTCPSYFLISKMASFMASSNGHLPIYHRDTHSTFCTHTQV
jgi:hypothetical protein